jgi:hypothetical protein
VVFWLIAAAHVLRIIFQVQVTVGRVGIPLWASIPPVIFCGGLALWVRREAGR